MNNYIIPAGVGAVVAGFVVGILLLMHFGANGQVAGTTAPSPAGSNFQVQTASVAINLANPGTNGTSTSLLNSDAGDRYVYGWGLACQKVGTSNTAYSGTGLSSLLFSLGTTSVANTASTSAAAFGGTPLTFNLPISTSTPEFGTSTPTVITGLGLPGATSTRAFVWNAGSNLDWLFNATNTAACTGWVNYIGS